MKFTLKECVTNRMPLNSEEDAAEVLSWLENALGITKNGYVTEKQIKKICNVHFEPTEGRMFDWIHDGKEESLREYFSAPWISELENVLMLRNGGCYFWHEIANCKQRALRDYLLEQGVRDEELDEVLSSFSEYVTEKELSIVTIFDNLSHLGVAYVEKVAGELDHHIDAVLDYEKLGKRVADSYYYYLPLSSGRIIQFDSQP